MTMTLDEHLAAKEALIAKNKAIAALWALDVPDLPYWTDFQELCADGEDRPEYGMDYPEAVTSMRERVAERHRWSEIEGVPYEDWHEHHGRKYYLEDLDHKAGHLALPDALVYDLFHDIYDALRYFKEGVVDTAELARQADRVIDVVGVDEYVRMLALG